MATVTPKTANWFTYFPEDYRWSSGLCGILGGAAYGGSELGEVDRAGRILKKHVGDDNAWFETWRAEGDRARSMAEAADKGNRRFTASGAYLRACNYYQMAERFRTPKDEPALDVYRQSVECFHHRGRRLAALPARPPHRRQHGDLRLAPEKL